MPDPARLTGTPPPHTRLAPALLAVVAALGTLSGCGTLVPAPAVSNPGMIDTTQTGPRSWFATLRDDVVLTPAEPGRPAWVACVQTADGMWRPSVRSQEKIERAHTTRIADARVADYLPAVHVRDVMDALAPGYRDRFNRRIAVRLQDLGSAGYWFERSIISVFHTGEPILVGVAGGTPDEPTTRCYLLTGMEYSEPKSVGVVERTLSFGAHLYELDAVELWDPTEPDARTLVTPEEIGKVRYVVSPNWVNDLWEQQLAWLDKHDRGPGLYVMSLAGPAAPPAAVINVEVPIDDIERAIESNPFDAIDATAE